MKSCVPKLSPIANISLRFFLNFFCQQSQTGAASEFNLVLFASYVKWASFVIRFVQGHLALFVRIFFRLIDLMQKILQCVWNTCCDGSSKPNI